MGPVERASAIATTIQTESEAVHRAGRLTETAYQALVSTNLFRACAPSYVGGDECVLRDGATIANTLARADMSTGWLFVQASAMAFNFGPRLPRPVAAQMFDGPGAVIAGGFPDGTARADKVDGGYVVSGQWAFGSGCLHATWFDARCYVYDQGERVTTRTGLFATTSCLVPRADVRIDETWDVVGMRGTGSNTYVIDRVFVPQERTLSMWEMAAPTEGLAYQIPALIYAHVQFAALALGGAAAGLDAFTELADEKQAALSRTPMRDMATTHRTLAVATSKLRAAEAYLQWTVELLMNAAASDVGVTIDARAQARLAVTAITDTALEIVDMLYRVAGTTGIFQSSRVHRVFHDVHVMAQQLFARPSHYENVGRFLLGLEHDRTLL